jgi:hypothetical protein
MTIVERRDPGISTEPFKKSTGAHVKRGSFWTEQEGFHIHYAAGLLVK